MSDISPATLVYGALLVALLFGLNEGRIALKSYWKRRRRRALAHFYANRRERKMRAQLQDWDGDSFSVPSQYTAP